MTRSFRTLVASLLLVAFTGAGCTKGPDAATIQASKRVTLDVWGVVDDLDVYQAAFAAYRAEHPNVQINYKRLRVEEYESQIVNALAEDRGPDIFLIHNDWVGKYLPKIVPMPAQTKIAYSIVTGTIQKQQSWELHTDPTMPLKSFKDQFADVVQKDALRTINVGTSDKPNYQERLLAMPLFVDTMALYYNKDLLNTAGIATPPENWVDFKDQVVKLTKIGPDGKILKSGAGIGTVKNVDRGIDIATALMMQSGAPMSDASGNPTFGMIPEELSGQVDVPPAYRAIEFYTSFADPTKETYTWNDSMPNSLDAFLSNQTAFFFGYSYYYDLIRARAPKLNLGLSKLPQIENNPVKNVANYWMWAVSKKSKSSDQAWHLLNFLAKSDNMKKLSVVAKRPPARKALLPDLLNDERLGVFASQVLTATTWYRGNDPQTMEAAFGEMLETAASSTLLIPRAVKDAADKISQTVTN